MASLLSARCTCPAYWRGMTHGRDGQPKARPACPVHEHTPATVTAEGETR